MAHNARDRLGSPSSPLAQTLVPARLFKPGCSTKSNCVPIQQGRRDSTFSAKPRSKHWATLLTNIPTSSSPTAQENHQPLYLEHLPIHFCVGLHRVLGNHVGDESKSFGFLGQSVYREMDLREGSCKRQGFSVRDVLTQPPHALNWHLLAKARAERSQGAALSTAEGVQQATSLGEELWLQTDKIGPAKALQLRLCTVWQLTGL